MKLPPARIRQQRMVYMNVYEGMLNAQNLRVGIVAARFNDFIVSHLVEGAKDALLRHGAQEDFISLVRVPGAFEIPLAAARLVADENIDAVICVGAVIRGATPHFDYVAAEVSKGIAQVSLSSGKPVSFGVLTTDTIDQAVERAGTKSGNKGFEAAVTVIEMVSLLAAMK